ncbi:MAG TPA: hypothetical protein VIJ99_06315 [Acidimicrobiales bacterium]
MTMTRTMIVVATLFYLFLWVLVGRGDSQVLPIVVIPAVLAVMIALGVALNRYMGLTPRKQHFDDRHDETEQ